MARPKGSMTRSKERLLKALQKEYGEEFEPVMQMARNAHQIQKIVDEMVAATMDFEELLQLLTQAINAWDRIAKYTTPTLKAVETTVTQEALSLEDIESELARYGVDTASLRTHPGSPISH